MKLRRLSDAVVAFLLCCLIGLITFFSTDAKEGAKSGIELCENVIIPSLLPILIICGVITNSRLSAVFERLFGAVFEKAFSLPRICAPAVVLGLIGGYPSGAVLTCSLFERGEINSSQAQRIMRFNFSSGAAFTVTAVGSVTYGSLKTGLLLYFSGLLSSLITALLSRFFIKQEKCNYTFVPSYYSIGDAFCNSVEGAVKALAVMAAYIVLFSAVFGIANPPEYLTPLLEITNGICRDKLIPPSYACFFLSFGGLCVHFQLFGLLRKMGVSYRAFFISRMEGAVLSFFIYKLYLLFFPEAEAVFSNVSAPVHSFSSGGAALSVLMIIGCAVAIFDIENRKLKLHSLL